MSKGAEKSRQALDRSMIGAVAWNAAAKWLSQAVGWTSTIIIARLLTPYDFGIMGMAGLFTVLATLVSQVGLGQAIVTLRDLPSRRIAQLNTVALMIGAALVAVSFLVAGPLASFFSAPPLREVVLVVSSSYMIMALQVVPRALLQKELKFKALATASTARFLAQAVISVALAWIGFRYWSLVIGYIAGTVVSTALLCRWRGHCFALPKFSELRRELHFGGNVLVTGVAWYCYDNSDFLVAGRVLGGASLGNYTLAWTIACTPVEKIANLVTGVTPAFFSATQRNAAELRRYLLGLTEVISYVTIPASLGLALVADPLVRALLGPKWLGAIAPLQVLGAFVAARSITTVLPNLLTSIGEAAFVMWATLAAAVAMPCAFYAGSRWGTAGIAAAWIVAYPLVILPILAKTISRIGIAPREYWARIQPAVIASAIMSSLVIAAARLFPGPASPLARLALRTSLGMLSYAGALFSLQRGRILRLVQALRAARRKPGREPAPLDQRSVSRGDNVR
ncbi:MAG TPA: lipopolysaccharide biosynthesis protein [Terriglobales bacterium]|nr:lipopolysaccharide biosynthesis protein [Terriglobales bacterium]